MAKKLTKVRLSDIERLSALQCTSAEAAAFLGVRKHVFTRLLNTDEQVKEAWERGKNMGLVSLRRKQFRLAKSNATMAIFLGKNYLGQREVVTQQLTGADGGPVELDLTKLSQEERDELRKFVDRAAGSRTDS